MIELAPQGRGQPGGWLRFCARQENRRFQWRLTCLTATHQWLVNRLWELKVTERRPPLVSRPFSRGNPVLPASMWRLRNSTWRGTHNVPHCGTDSVPGGRKLGRNPSHGHLYRRHQSESTRLFPQTELRLTCHRCTVLAESPLSSRAARHATRGKRQRRTNALSH